MRSIFPQPVPVNTKGDIEAWMATIPKAQPCPRHGPDAEPLDREQTIRESLNNKFAMAFYARCQECLAIENEERTRAALLRANVPANLLQATLNNWIATTPDEQSALEEMRRYADAPKGFLVLLGGVGTGKSHGAVAIGRRHIECRHRGFLMFTQSNLLRALRDTYSDKKADDPVEKCENASLLVLDELGVSAGGRDEFPLIHDVIDERYRNMKPLILTSNLTYDELMAQLGDRIHDRIREAASAILSFAGKSHRAAMRERYLADPNHSVVAEWLEKIRSSI